MLARSWLLQTGTVRRPSILTSRFNGSRPSIADFKCKSKWILGDERTRGMFPSLRFAKLNDWWLFYPFYPLTIGAASLVSAGVPDNLDVQQALQIPSNVPALFIHHPGDKITPYRTARRIFNKYHGPKQWITLEKKYSWERHMTAGYDLEIRAEILRFLKRN